MDLTRVRHVLTRHTPGKIFDLAEKNISDCHHWHSDPLAVPAFHSLNGTGFLGFGISGAAAGFRVQGPGFRVQSLEFRVQGLGFLHLDFRARKSA